MLNLSPMGKLFFGSLVAWIIKDAALPFKIKGSPQEMEALAKAVFAAKRFHDELKRPGVTIQDVIDRLNDKNTAAEEFKTVTNMDFPF